MNTHISVNYSISENYTNHEERKDIKMKFDNIISKNKCLDLNNEFGKIQNDKNNNSSSKTRLCNFVQNSDSKIFLKDELEFNSKRIDQNSDILINNIKKKEKSNLEQKNCDKHLNLIQNESKNLNNILVQSNKLKESQMNIFNEHTYQISLTSKHENLNQNFFNNIPKSHSVEKIFKLKNISSVSSNSSNILNKTFSTISNNLLNNISLKNKSKIDETKKNNLQKKNVKNINSNQIKFDKNLNNDILNLSKNLKNSNNTNDKLINEEDDYEMQTCDHEPGLEFDDSELENPKIDNDCLNDLAEEHSECSGDLNYLFSDSKISNLSYLESPDDLMEENFEEALRDVVNEEDLNSFFSIEENVSENTDLNKLRNNLKNDIDFTELSKYGIIEIAGDDMFGRKIITIYACRLPLNNTIDHNKLLKYIMYTLDQYVENDYCLVYFHYGLNSNNKPSLSWLWQAIKAFDRRYKKNLKALYLVHPTKFIRFVWRLFKPVISAKFGKKVQYVNYLHELKEHLHFEQLIIPNQVIEHDRKLLKIAKKTSWFNTSLINSNLRSSSISFYQRLDTQQFRVSLSFLKEHNNGEVIAPVVKSCINYLNNENALQTEGIFRRSPNVQIVKEVQEQFNNGEKVDFNKFEGEQGYHIATVILKTFLRELEEPLFSFDLYDDIIDFQQLNSGISNLEKLAIAKSLIVQRLNSDNYKLLKYIVEFLVKVMDRSDLNKMTAFNLAIVFGPNLLWSKNKQATLTSITSINHFTEFLLKNYYLIFVK